MASKGVVLTLDPSTIKIQTANTRPGLIYVFSEVTKLTQKSPKEGDGKTRTPAITVNGGTSGFYSSGAKR